MARNSGSTLVEVLEYGPIVAVNDDLGCDAPLLLTVNGAYYNLWTPCGDGTWHCADCFPTGSENGLYSLTVAQALDRAKEILDEAINPPKDEE